MLCSLKAEASVGAGDNDCLTAEVVCWYSRCLKDLSNVHLENIRRKTHCVFFSSAVSKLYQMPEKRREWYTYSHDRAAWLDIYIYLDSM